MGPHEPVSKPVSQPIAWQYRLIHKKIKAKLKILFLFQYLFLMTRLYNNIDICISIIIVFFLHITEHIIHFKGLFGVLEEGCDNNGENNSIFDQGERTFKLYFLITETIKSASFASSYGK